MQGRKHWREGGQLCPPPPFFGRLVNPIPTKGRGRLCPQNYYNFQTFLGPWIEIIVLRSDCFTWEFKRNLYEWLFLKIQKRKKIMRYSCHRSTKCWICVDKQFIFSILIGLDQNKLLTFSEFVNSWNYDVNCSQR